MYILCNVALRLMSKLPAQSSGRSSTTFPAIRCKMARSCARRSVDLAVEIGPERRFPSVFMPILRPQQALLTLTHLLDVLRSH